MRSGRRCKRAPAYLRKQMNRVLPAGRTRSYKDTHGASLTQNSAKLYTRYAIPDRVRRLRSPLTHVLVGHRYRQVIKC